MNQLEMDDELSFWHEQAKKLPWFKPWDEVLKWQEPYAHWFKGGMINASYACLDQHILQGRGSAVACYWEDERGNTKQWTYNELYKQVNWFAHNLKQQGVKKGDIVILYLPMMLESVAVMLACARIGATHSVVFSGFSSQALQSRIEDTRAKFIVTADGSYRRGNYINLKTIVDDAVNRGSSIERVFIIQRYSQEPLVLHPSRDVILNSIIEKEVFVEPEPLEANHPLFILYTSGTTGKPKGLVHSTGGYLTYTYATFKWAFDPKPQDVYWCTADIGWITGHSYVVYAPLMHGVSIVIHEGAPDYPDPGIWWRLVEKYNISIFYTSPTALRLCMKHGNEWPMTYDLSSLKIVGSVGEPINPEVWQWYHTVIGKGRCPVIDTWWQTETGGFMIAPAPYFDLIKLKPGSATLPLPGIKAEVVDIHGVPVSTGKKGFLVINNPWPGMTIGILGDDQRFRDTYWSKFQHRYYSGDYAIKDSDGYFWLLGRADEVLNIAGHRIGTAEIESAVVALPVVAEAAAVGIKDDIKGEVVVVFAILKQDIESSLQLKEEVTNAVRIALGKFVQPKEVFFVDKLPKTRSGKIMRRLLKAVVENTDIGDISTLEDEASVEDVKDSFYQIKQRVGSSQLF